MLRAEELSTRVKAMLSAKVVDGSTEHWWREAATVRLPDGSFYRTRQSPLDGGLTFVAFENNS